MCGKIGRNSPGPKNKQCGEGWWAQSYRAVGKAEAFKSQLPQAGTSPWVPG